MRHTCGRALARRPAALAPSRVLGFVPGMKQTARQAWDIQQIARAVNYTTARFLGRGRYDTRRFDTLADALADARGDYRALVYAITPEGFTVHVVNGDKIATG
jgi:hypothetical protein